MLNNIRIVLVETSHPGNIGAAARAMKTMGLSELILVNPKDFPSAPATARAAGADDILYRARIAGSLVEALKGCELACATTARRRELSVPPAPPRALAPALLERAEGGPVAIVFGRESSGLNNAEVQMCQAFAQIPTAPDYASLNLAAAVQLFAYELRLAALTELDSDPAGGEPAARAGISVDELEGLYGHLEAALTTIGYLDPARPKKLMPRLRALFGRANLDRAELQILRGVLSSAEQAAGRKS